MHKELGIWAQLHGHSLVGGQSWGRVALMAGALQ